MTFNAAALKLMADKGLSAHDIAEIAAANETRRDPTAADRMARMREKQRNGVTRNVTRTPPKENKSNPPVPICSSEQTTPDWLPEKPWHDFVEMRRSMGKRAPFTPAAERNIIAKLEKLKAEGHDPAELLSEAVARGWRGIFAPERKATGPPSFLDHLVEAGARQ